MTTHVTEIAADVFRISTYLADYGLQFNQFLIRDEAPLLYHTGMRSLFDTVRDGVARVLDPATIRWVGFSHFEADECGALADWQRLAPRAEGVCSLVGKLVSVDDVVALRPVRGLSDDEAIETGSHRVRFLQTPHVPHCWEAGLMFEESQRVLFCSDLFSHKGEVPEQTDHDVVGPSKQALDEDRGGPFANAYPYTPHTAATLARLAALDPAVLAIMHGSTFTGNCKTALGELDGVLRQAAG